MRLKMNNNIIIKDWAGNILYEGDKDHPNVDKVLEANRCWVDHDNLPQPRTLGRSVDCTACNDTGYATDFEVYWQDASRKDNVYEFINY